MKRIDLNTYQSNMGTLIDLSEPIDYVKQKDSINIPYQKLLLHYEEYLDKNKKYYIMCSKGIHSKKLVNILEFYGYDVTQVIKNN
jgi:rhodanese-related sulfurtransferase